MQVKNHWIEDIRHTTTSNLGTGRIAPRFIVTHYTTGWSGETSRNWLQGAAGGQPASRVSAHVVIDTNGGAWQIAPFNRATWHAGPSFHAGISGLNEHSIGLEFANPGWLRPAGAEQWVDDYGHRRTTRQLEDRGGFIEAPYPRAGSGRFAWPLYPEAQIATGLAIAAALMAAYRIEAVLTHEEIDTRGWKTDPGPAFPHRAFADLLGEATPGPQLWRVTATRLNLRGGPAELAERIDPPGVLPRGTEVQVLGAEGVWRYVEVKALAADAAASFPGLVVGLRGWAHGRYLEPAL